MSGEENVHNNWLKFQPSHLALSTAKAAINYASKHLFRIIGSVEPTMPLTKIVDKVFLRLETLYDQEEAINPAVRDGNFKQLMKTARNALIFIAEQDCYYQDWLALFLNVLVDEYGRSYNEFDPSSDSRLVKLFTPEQLSDESMKLLYFYWSHRYNIPIVKEKK